MGKEPMLAAKASLETIPYPVFASPKFDGVRAIVEDKLLSRKLKPIPNIRIQALYAPYLDQMKNFDGELVVGKSFNQSTKVIMASDVDIPETFCYYVFDRIAEGNYATRFVPIVKKPFQIPHVQIVSSVLIRDQEHLLAYEEQCINEGYEGIMLRRADGQDTYKFGRSTTNEGYLLKLKRFEDEEALIIGFEELMSNQNEATKDATGHTERSSKAEGKVPMGTLGSLVVMSKRFGEFKLGTGFTAEQRQEIWNKRDWYKGKWAKYHYQLAGLKDKPRFPVYIGLRSEGDM